MILCNVKRIQIEQPRVGWIFRRYSIFAKLVWYSACEVTVVTVIAPAFVAWESLVASVLRLVADKSSEKEYFNPCGKSNQLVVQLVYA